VLARAAVLAALCLVAAASAATASTRTDTAALLARYEPQFEQYAADWKPSAVDPFLANADLERSSGLRWIVVRHSPPATALAKGSTSLRLDTRGCSPAVDTDACYHRTATKPTVYGRVWTAGSGSGYSSVLQYWLFYPLDDWRNSLTRPTLWHMHEGDWEEVSVALGVDGKPVAVACSQHNLGVTRTWSRVRIKNSTHPYVYIALGSHANYFLPGFHGLASLPHVIPPRFSGVPLPEPDHTSAQAPVQPAIADVSDGLAPWLSFAGAWGDGNFVLVSGRSGFAHLRVGISPPGPAFHDIWRDPLLQFRSWPADDGH
jgi:hypothetical protein